MVGTCRYLFALYVRFCVSTLADAPACLFLWRPFRDVKPYFTFDRPCRAEHMAAKGPCKKGSTDIEMHGDVFLQ